ncbi:MAG TPA: class III extradiol dioxygenase family protein [Burkholderiales bacterium]|jgi:protocatechuate 4,5-dioxygenase beta chain
MARIIAGIGSSHVPSVGGAHDRGRQEEAAWKPLFDSFVPVREWLTRIKPDVAIVVYNDHAAEFFFDRYPTFALGAAESYGIADEGFGVRPLPTVPGHLAFSQHLCEALVYDEFDLTVCQELKVEHGFLVPMHLCFDYSLGWPLASVPLQVNVLQHPLPTARRCFRLGQAIGRAVASFPQDLKVVIIGTGGMSHQLTGSGFGDMQRDNDMDFLDRLESNPESLTDWTHQQFMERFGVEGIELIMWLVMRGALPQTVRRMHRNYYAPMTTGMGVITLEPA